MNDEYETYLYEQLAMAHKAYEAAAKPLINELVKLKALKPAPPIYINLLTLPPEQRRFIEDMVKKGLK